MCSPDLRARGAAVGRLVVAGAALAGALTACSASTTPPASAPVATVTTSTTAPSSASATTLPPLPAKPAPLAASTTSAPVRLQVPAIGVDTALQGLGLLADGSLASPTAWSTAGWYDKGVRPGDAGPAIVAGHVDSYLGPAVFYRLDKLTAGDVAIVTRADHSVVKFVVESTAQYPKAHFPTAEVYGPTPTPELRLITCTGIFDRSIRSYEDNLVVTAVLAS